MNCPHCHRELTSPEPSVCPACGTAISPAPPIASPSPIGSGFYWLIFFGVLLAPPLLTVLAVWGGRKTNDLAVAIALLGGAAGGIATGGMLGHRLGKTPQGRLLLGFVLAGVFSVVCIGMSFFGCMAGGYHLDFK